MSKTSLTIMLLATLALTLIVPAVSGISLLQQAKAATSNQKGMNGIIESGAGCTPISTYVPRCFVNGGPGGGFNGGTEGSFNGNGWNGGKIVVCTGPRQATICHASGGEGGSFNSDNSGGSRNGNGGDAGGIGSCFSQLPATSVAGICFANGGLGGLYNSGNSGTSRNGNGGNGGEVTCTVTAGHCLRQ
ncbi:MAG: hypothetical protein WAM42_07435 [Candidatus Nitrosopolaris sp.]